MTCLVTLEELPSGYVTWLLWDGPDGAWERQGTSLSLQCALTAVERAREQIARDVTGLS